MREAWAVIWVASVTVAVLGAAGAQGATPTDSIVSGVHYANQVVRDTAADSVVATSGAAAKSQQSTPVVVDDIAQFSSKTVTFHDLGLVVRNQERGRVAVRVHDAAGREVLAKDYGPGRATISVAMDRIPRGIYVYSVRVADSVYARTFVVTR